jgi:hypothetical protein
MVGPLRGAVGDLGVSTTYVRDVNDGPPESSVSVHGLKMCCDLDQDR